MRTLLLGNRLNFPNLKLVSESAAKSKSYTFVLSELMGPQQQFACHRLGPVNPEHDH